VLRLRLLRRRLLLPVLRGKETQTQQQKVRAVRGSKLKHREKAMTEKRRKEGPFQVVKLQGGGEGRKGRERSGHGKRWGMALAISSGNTCDRCEG
jgi:hypothetical protein